MQSVSLIIPFYNEYDELNKILNAIPNWSLFPSEIIIVNTATLNKKEVVNDYKSVFDDIGIEFHLIEHIGAYPGRARNLGINFSNCELIAFLDAKTFPQNEWLENGVNQINDSNISVSYGQTIYEANSLLEKNVRSCTFGVNPLRTLPGSIIKKKIFQHVGLFIEHVRAGEDGDWFSRMNIHRQKFNYNSKLINYSGLIGINIRTLLGKWYRNYLSSTQLPHLKAHKDIYFYFFGFCLLLLAFNWNNLSYDPDISGWNTNSIFYIPNVTKTIFAVLILIYFFTRSIILPLRKGVKFSSLLPFNFMFIFFLSVALDSIKITAFLIGRFQNIVNLFK